MYAIDCGVDMVEVDVMTTKDGVPILHHGLRFSAWGRKQLPEILSYDSLKSLRPGTTSLDEAILACKDKVDIDIDIKTRKVDPILNTVKKHFSGKETEQHILFSSHMVRPLKRVRKRQPKASIALYSLNPIKWWFYLKSLRLYAVGFPKSQRIFIQPLARKLGLKTYCYSINDKQTANYLKNTGTWAIITNKPFKLINKD